MSLTYVKMRERGSKTFWFVDAHGNGTRLRTHAARFESKESAVAFVAKYAPENPDLEFKVIAARSHESPH